MGGRATACLLSLCLIAAVGCESPPRAPGRSPERPSSTTELWRGEPGSGMLRALWGDDRGRLWAVGDGGLIVHFDGRRWRRQASPSSADLVAIHGCAEGEIWAVGGETVLRSRGGRWLVEYPLGHHPLELRSVFCARPGDVWAAERHFVIRRTPSTGRWQRVGRRAIEEPHAPRVVWGPRGGGLWVGDDTSIFRFTGGATWAREDRFESPVNALAGTAHERWAGTASGLFRYEPPASRDGRPGEWLPAAPPSRLRVAPITSLLLTASKTLHALGPAGLLRRSAAGDWRYDERLALDGGALRLHALGQTGADDERVYAVGGRRGPEGRSSAVVLRIDDVVDAPPR